MKLIFNQKNQKFNFFLFVEKYDILIEKQFIAAYSTPLGIPQWTLTEPPAAIKYFSRLPPIK